MAIAQLQGFDCLDHDPIDKWVPTSDDLVCFQLCMHIGLADDDGADLFYVQVVTPQAINRRNLGRQLRENRIVVNPYSWPEVLWQVAEILGRCEGESWGQVSRLPSSHFDWEFGDCRP